MIPIEILAITFATLGALTAAACVTIALYARYKGSKSALDSEIITGISFLWPSDTYDLPQANHIEITIAKHPDGTRLWVNVDGANAFRAYKVKNLTIDDRRDWSMEAALKTR